MASINPGTGAIDLGDIQSETQSKNSQLFQTPMPTQDSDKAVLFDLFGVIKNIRVSGIFTGTQTQQNTFINAIETICSGEQEGATFVSSKEGYDSKEVYIDNFEWTVNKSDVEKIDYSLTMIEGDD